MGRVESRDGTLYRMTKDGERAIAGGGTLHTGDTLRADGGGAMLALRDGSRVEMREQSQLALDQEADGVRLRLIQGGVIVNAAPQRDGHLYVQTKDVVVSVVGTVFYVQAEEQGSRVAVIHGEVRVQQAASEHRLFPGEQVATNALMEAPAVSREIAWSRQATAHLALLRQSTPEREAFEEVAIRLRRGGTGVGQRGQGGAVSPCQSEHDPHRYVLRNVTVYNLISLAYFNECRAPAAVFALLSGGPDWAKSETYDIEAIIPDGGPAVYTDRLLSGAKVKEGTPRLRKMQQTLLAERFGLELRREKKEMQVYLLTTAKGGPKLTPWTEGDFANLGATQLGPYEDVINLSPEHNYGREIVASINGNKSSMAQLANQIQRVTGRLVFDRTGIPGYFTYEFVFAPTEFYGARIAEAYAGSPVLSTPLYTALEDELGLHLVPTTENVEILVIDHVERPSLN